MTLPSISLFHQPNSRMIQRSEITCQLVAILVFRGNVTILLPFWRTLSTGKVRPDGGHAKKTSKAKNAPSAPLLVLENVWRTKDE
jgi:hypothetical protein